jgi:hypothetical protein
MAPQRAALIVFEEVLASPRSLPFTGMHGQAPADTGGATKLSRHDNALTADSETRSARTRAPAKGVGASAGRKREREGFTARLSTEIDAKQFDPTSLCPHRRAVQKQYWHQFR